MFKFPTSLFEYLETEYTDDELDQIDETLVIPISIGDLIAFAQAHVKRERAEVALEKLVSVENKEALEQNIEEAEEFIYGLMDQYFEDCQCETCKQANKENLI